MNTELLQTIEKRISVALGALVLVQADNLDEEQELFLNSAKAELIGTNKGLRIIIDAVTNNPVTIGELEERQFNRANEVIPEKALEEMHGKTS